MVQYATVSMMGDRAGGDLIRRAAVAAVLVAICLTLLKGIVWLLSGSVAMLSSAIDSALDAFASFVNLLAVRHALEPADREHRFGHGKAEPLAGLVQAAFIGGSVVLLLASGIPRLLHPEPILLSEYGIAVSLLAMAATFALVAYQRRVVRQTGSVAIGADSLHYAGDMLMNGGVILSLVLSGQMGVDYADPAFAILVGLWMLRSVFAISRQSLDHLMDRELPAEARERIKRLAMAHPAAGAVHDLRTRSAGTSTFIQFHLELDGEMSLNQAHSIADSIEADILAEFPGAEVIIHQDPAGLTEPGTPVYPRQ